MTDNPKPHPPGDRAQLERSAEVFEMILQTSPDAVENYLTLKDIYRQLQRNSDFSRITKGLAQVYLNANQPDKAAKEYAEALEIDPGDAEVLAKLQQLGFAAHDAETLKLNLTLQDIRAQCQQKLKELEKAEQLFLKASAKVRDARRGDDEETSNALRAIEEAAEKELRELLQEHERWLEHGRTEVFNQVAESLKKKADGIIEENEFGDVRKSVKKAEKLLAATDRVFEEEWRRLGEERDREFRAKTDELKRKHEMQLRAAWQEVVARSEREQAAADLQLRKVKDDLREIQATLREKEKIAQSAIVTQASSPASSEILNPQSKIQNPPSVSSPFRAELSSQPAQTSDASDTAGRAASAPSHEASRLGRPVSSLRHEAALKKPGVVVVAPPTMQGNDQPLPEERARTSQAARPATTRDEVGKALGAILVQHGVVTRDRLDEVLARQGKDHRPLGELLVEAGYATQEDIISALVAQSGVPYLPLENYEVSDDVAGVIPGELARKLALMPVDTIGGTLLIAMAVPLNNEQKQELQRHLGALKVKYFIAHWSEIKAKHERHYA